MPVSENKLLLRSGDKLLLRSGDNLILQVVTTRDDTKFTQLHATATPGKLTTFLPKGDSQDSLLLLGVS
jgi:hypothetical protein